MEWQKTCGNCSYALGISGIGSLVFVKVCVA